MTVWIVQVLRGETSLDIHVFSTQEKAQAFAYERSEPCVITDYEVDRPDLYYAAAAVE